MPIIMTPKIQNNPQYWASALFSWFLLQSRNGSNIKIRLMSGMIAHLKRRNMKKIWEEEGSLPQIALKKMNKIVQAVTSKSQAKPVFRYISEVTFNSEDEPIDSPQQLIVENECFFMSENNNNSSNWQRNLSVKESQAPHFRVQNRNMVKQNYLQDGKKQVSQRPKATANDKRRVVKPKQSLQQILMHKDRFIRKYFEDIHHQLQK